MQTLCLRCTSCSCGLPAASSAIFLTRQNNPIFWLNFGAGFLARRATLKLWYGYFTMHAAIPICKVYSTFLFLFLVFAQTLSTNITTYFTAMPVHSCRILLDAHAHPSFPTHSTKVFFVFPATFVVLGIFLAYSRQFLKLTKPKFSHLCFMVMFFPLACCKCMDAYFHDQPILKWGTIFLLWNLCFVGARSLSLCLPKRDLPMKVTLMVWGDGVM